MSDFLDLAPSLETPLINTVLNIVERKTVGWSERTAGKTRRIHACPSNRSRRRDRLFKLVPFVRVGASERGRGFVLVSERDGVADRSRIEPTGRGSSQRRPMMIYRVVDLWLNRAGKWPRLEGLYSIKS